MDQIAHTIQFVIQAALWLVAMTLVFAVTVSLLPRDNPLHQLLAALTRRLAVTAGVTLVTPFIEPIPGIDVLYDIAGPVFLVWMWVNFIRNELMADSPPSRRRQAPVIDAELPAVQPRGRR